MQSALQPVPTASPGYIWATMPSAADVIYQTPQAYQGAELADAAFVDGTTVEVSGHHTIALYTFAFNIKLYFPASSHK